MKNFDSTEAVFKGSADQLSKLINLDATSPLPWDTKDRPAILRHQLSASIALDLAKIRPKDKSAEIRRKALRQAATLQIKTFRDLFQHPQPPLALLRLVKDFFKSHASPNANRSPDQEVAYLLYILSILVAKIRLDTSISSLSNRDLLPALEWAAAQNWLDSDTTALISTGRNKLLPN